MSLDSKHHTPKAESPRLAHIPKHLVPSSANSRMRGDPMRSVSGTRNTPRHLVPSGEKFVTAIEASGSTTPACRSRVT